MGRVGTKGLVELGPPVSRGRACLLLPRGMTPEPQDPPVGGKGETKLLKKRHVLCTIEAAGLFSWNGLWIYGGEGCLTQNRRRISFFQREIFFPFYYTEVMVWADSSGIYTYEALLFSSPKKKQFLGEIHGSSSSSSGQNHPPHKKKTGCNSYLS